MMPGPGDIATVPDDPAASPEGEIRGSGNPLFSVLYPDSLAHDEAMAAPVDDLAVAAFRDLGLDQLFAALTVGRERHRLGAHLSHPLRSVAAVRYRQEIFADLDGTPTLEAVRSFADRLGDMRAQLEQAAQLRHPRQQQRWFLDAATTYRDGVRGLLGDLRGCHLAATGLIRLRAYLEDQVRSTVFEELSRDVDAVRAGLEAVEYCVEIRGRRVQVTRFAQQADYRSQVQETFARFQQGSVARHPYKGRQQPELDHVGGHILDLVAELFPEAFAALDTFVDRHRHFLDPTIESIDHELQFYVAYLDHLAPLRRRGLEFCRPDVRDRLEGMMATATFDLALATRLGPEGGTVVTNDVALGPDERVIVVTGPNQGGKTTLARTVGQIHHLAAIGCLVPGTSAALGLFDRLCTHFEREEDLSTLQGKLQDDLVRVHAILDRATDRSVIIFNEIFTSTTLDDARLLGANILRQVLDLGAHAVYVTFVDELATLDPAVVSMVSTVRSDDPTIRTFEVVRRPADGLAHAAALADKYGLSYQRLGKRIRP